MILENEALIRLASFCAILLGLLVLETIYPRRTQTQSRMLRWTNNFAVSLLNTILLRLLFPAAAVGLALHQEGSGFGLFEWLNLPLIISVVASVIILDFLIYAQHVILHQVPILWRVHRMHHSDLEIDVTTGARFHPIEIILSMLVKLFAVWILGAPAIAVIIFEVLLNALAMFNHSNLNLPLNIDEQLRKVIVTPDMHRVHHSTDTNEMNSNYGFCLSCWDRWLNTYTEQPAAGHLEMQIGLNEFREQSDIRLDRMLQQPFISRPNES